MRRSFMGCNVGLKVREKRWTNEFGNVELKAMKTIEQPTINQNKNEDYQHPNPK